MAIEFGSDASAASGDDLVDGVWHAPQSIVSTLILPDGCVDLVDRAGRLFVVGPMSVARSVTLAAGPAQGIRFRPGAVRPWLGISPKELRDAVVPVDDVPALRGLDTLAAVLAQARVQPVSRRFGAAVKTLEQRPDASISAVASALGWSPRQLRRRFIDEVGLRPKQFARIQRFRALTAQLAAAPKPHLAALAAAFGYADQAHMSREVKALAGHAPHTLVRHMSVLFKTAPDRAG